MFTRSPNLAVRTAARTAGSSVSRAMVRFRRAASMSDSSAMQPWSVSASAACGPGRPGWLRPVDQLGHELVERVRLATERREGLVQGLEGEGDSAAESGKGAFIGSHRSRPAASTSRSTLMSIKPSRTLTLPSAQEVELVALLFAPRRQRLKLDVDVTEMVSEGPPLPTRHGRALTCIPPNYGVRRTGRRPNRPATPGRVNLWATAGPSRLAPRPRGR